MAAVTLREYEFRRYLYRPDSCGDEDEFVHRTQAIEPIFLELDRILGKSIQAINVEYMRAIDDSGRMFPIVDAIALHEIALLNGRLASCYLTEELGIANELLDAYGSQPWGNEEWQLDYAIRLTGLQVERFMKHIIRDPFDRLWVADVPKEVTNDAIVHNLTHSPRHEDFRRKLHTELKSWMWASFHDFTDAWISFGSEDLLYRFLAHRVLSHFTWNFPAVEFQVPAAEFLREFRSTLAAEAGQGFDLAVAENVRYPDRLVATKRRVSIVYHINSGKWRLDVDPAAPRSEEQSNT